jgi:hypothetical protein
MSDQGSALPPKSEGVSLTLFIGGNHATSTRAGEALDDALKHHEVLREHLRVIDVFDEPRAALGAGVVATPSLLAAEGDRRLWMIGDLDDRTELETFLRSFSEGIGRKTAPGTGGPDDGRDAGQ